MKVIKSYCLHSLFPRASFNLNPLASVLSAGAGIVGTHFHILHPRLSKVPTDLCTQELSEEQNSQYIHMWQKHIEATQLFGNRGTQTGNRRGT